MDESSERKILRRARRAEFAEKLADLEQEAQDIEDEAAHDATESSPANFEHYHTKAGARLQNLQARYFQTPASSFKEPRPPPSLNWFRFWFQDQDNADKPWKPPSKPKGFAHHQHGQKRFAQLLSVFHESTRTPEEFVEQAANPCTTGTREELEDAAVRRMLRGYGEPGCETQWRRATRPHFRANQMPDIADRVQAISERAALELHERLKANHQTGRIWKEPEVAPSKRNFTRMHTRPLTRNSLLQNGKNRAKKNNRAELDRALVPSSSSELVVFLDPFWNLQDRKDDSFSKSFPYLLDALLEHIPNEPMGPGEVRAPLTMAAARWEGSQAAVLGVIGAISRDLLDGIKDFIAEHPDASSGPQVVEAVRAVPAWNGQFPSLVLLVSCYSIVDNFSGLTFFDNWDFHVNHDILTLGDVVSLNEADVFTQELALVNAARDVIITVDNFSNLPFNQKRNSVRITTKASYSLTVGLILPRKLVDYRHRTSAFGCSTGPTWRAGGQIDIIEGINLETSNQVALHTATGWLRDAHGWPTWVVNRRRNHAQEKHLIIGHILLDTSFAAATSGRTYIPCRLPKTEWTNFTSSEL
ncbi:hypothetical protein B0H14DRAFT_3680757 [Mycena olivaceomarginata]|nr:hypothetical protein B0H14DRAFT_3680757 [Mycena olivaceomarginata]